MWFDPARLKMSLQSHSIYIIVGVQSTNIEMAVTDLKCDASSNLKSEVISMRFLKKFLIGFSITVLCHLIQNCTELTRDASIDTDESDNLPSLANLSALSLAV